MSLLERILEAAESCLNWSMGDQSIPEDQVEAKIKEFEHMVQEGQEQVATYAAGIHCLSEQLQQLEQTEMPDTGRHFQLITEKREELAQSKQVYKRLKKTLRQLDEQLATAKRKQDDLTTRALLKGRNEDG